MHAHAPTLPFTGPALLAPMEGVTEPCFRDLVIERNEGALGGAFTEFVRVLRIPVPRQALREHLGPRRYATPVGLQLMGADLAALAETARRAVEVGAPLVDLNFGCPSKGALRGCAGSALLDDPPALERVVRACAEAVPGTPVTAKIRAGGDDDALLEDLARAAEAGGARLLTVHCRTRAEAYRDTADWDRLARAAAAVAIPVCGNGGIDTHADLDAVRRATGCAYAMVGRGALADPWIFSGHRATPAEAARFLLEYAARLRAERGAGERMVAGRLKQLLGHWTAGGLAGAERRSWLRLASVRELLERIGEAGAREPLSVHRRPHPPGSTGARAVR